ncbi:MAG: acetylglutamate kinase [Bacteroidia bacterium]
MKKPLYIIKLGGNLLDDEEAIQTLLEVAVASGKDFLLVHGGGSQATRMAERLGVPQNRVDGRRITDPATLDIALMCYAGLLNKKLVAGLQAVGKNCLGMSGADANTVPATLRSKDGLDYGLVGDPLPERVNSSFLKVLIELGITPVFCALTHDEKGQMLNTNADTMAQTLAIAMSDHYATELIYLFEKAGVLKDVDDPASLITRLTCIEIPLLQAENSIHDGMIPKLQNACKAVHSGVKRVVIGASSQLREILAGDEEAATYVYP